jgi:MFS family permease
MLIRSVTPKPISVGFADGRDRIGVILAIVLPSPYDRLLSVRRLRQPLVGSLIGRLPIAALSLAIVLMIQKATGSFASAGAVAAVFAIAGAVSLPVQGRLIDRLGQTRVLLVGAVLHPLALTALVVAAERHAASPLLTILGVLCGATVPAVPSCMRTLWADLVPNGDLLLTAYALDAVLFEVAFVVGPLTTAVVVAVASPAAAVLVNAVCAFLGAFTFALSTASRAWRSRAVADDWAGALRSRGIAVLLMVELTFGIALGAMELSVTAFATERGSAELAGVMIAVQAAASMAGGLWYGVHQSNAAAAQRYPLLCLLIAIGLAPLLFASSIANAVPLMALSGFALAPATAVAYLLIEELSPRGTLTEASTWLITAVIAGIAAGNAVAGALITGGHSHRGFAVSVAAALLGWLIAARGRRALSAGILTA